MLDGHQRSKATRLLRLITPHRSCLERETIAIYCEFDARLKFMQTVLSRHDDDGNGQQACFNHVRFGLCCHFQECQTKSKHFSKHVGIKPCHPLDGYHRLTSRSELQPHVDINFIISFLNLLLANLTSLLTPIPSMYERTSAATSRTTFEEHRCHLSSQFS